MLFGTKDWTKFQKGFKIQVWAHAQTLTSPAQIIIVFNDKNPWSKKKNQKPKIKSKTSDYNWWSRGTPY